MAVHIRRGGTGAYAKGSARAILVEPAPCGKETVLAISPSYSVRSVERVVVGADAIPALLVHSDAPGTRPAVLIQHGYGAGKSDLLPLAEILARYGFISLLPDAWGHGERFPASGPNWLTELTADYFHEVLRHTLRSLRTCLDTLVEMAGVRAHTVLLAGFSMGAVAALLLGVLDARVAGVISASGSAASDLLDISIAGSRVPGPEARAWALEHDAAAHLARLAPRPLLLQHGRTDDLIPVANTLRLYEAARPFYADSPERLGLMLYDHRHTVSQEQIEDAVSWTAARFGE